MSPHSAEEQDREKHPVINPATGEVIGQITWSTPEEVDQAVEKASRAFETWSRLTLKQRVQVFFRFKTILENNLDELSELCTLENGKTVTESKAGIEKGIEVIEYAASLPQILTGGYQEVSPGVSCRMINEPLGVVAGVTPFNFPVMVPLWMIPIALACGNTMVHKPSEQVPLSAIRLREHLIEAGLPEDAFQLVHGAREVVESLVDHPGIQALAFVGSSKVARIVYERGTRLGKRVLALGGAKNHLVLLPDADTELSADNITTSFCGCTGQRCMAAAVLLAVGDTQETVDKVVDMAKNITLGQDMGPVISRQALERITGYIDQAEKAGAKVLLDGRNASVPGKEGGFWIGPIILDNVTPDMQVAQEEIFGPVLTIIRVSTLTEALEIERKSEYGNAAAVYTRDGGLAKKCAESFNASMIGINIGVPVPREPFSFGGRGQSRFGVGDITGEGGIAFWTQTKKITERWGLPEGEEWRF